METNGVNSVAERVISAQEADNPYSPNRLILYHTSAALVEKLMNNGVLTPSNYKKAIDVLNKKYGLSSGSIFAETA